MATVNVLQIRIGRPTPKRSTPEMSRARRLPSQPSLHKMKLPGGFEFRHGSRSFPCELSGPYRVPQWPWERDRIAGAVSVLGSEETLFHLLATQLSPQSLGTQLADFEQAAHRQAKECFAGPQTALSATPTQSLYLIILLFGVVG